VGVALVVISALGAPVGVRMDELREVFPRTATTVRDHPRADEPALPTPRAVESTAVEQPVEAPDRAVSLAAASTGESPAPTYTLAATTTDAPSPVSAPEPQPAPAPPAPPTSRHVAVAAPETDAEAALTSVAPASIPLPLPAPQRPPLPPTPAERLKLSKEERVKAERCLAEAVYFEARGEPHRGQVAVAQVVMNRVFSPHYPDDVCEVVYQNAHRHLSCQFTFACDGIPETVTDRRAWVLARRIAKETLDGKIWEPAVAKSTHYHATYVRPVWVREMKKMFHYGVHTFYRPHRWGDGSREQNWSLVATHASFQARAVK
jgi:spore germination cell wall hydrolase CwlJ-like protein